MRIEQASGRRFRLSYLFFAFMTAIIVFVETTDAQYLNPVISVSGEVLNRSTNNAIDAKISVYTEGGGRVFRTKSSKSRGGSFFITGLKPSRVYIVVVEKKGFIQEKLRIETPNTDKYAEINKKIVLSPR
jgi:hypothetical protein